jgi:hypothetical protein
MREPSPFKIDTFPNVFSGSNEGAAMEAEEAEGGSGECL